MSDSEVLLAINSALQGVQTKVVKAGPKVDKIRVISSQRAEIQDKISKRLNQLRVRYVNEIDKSESSFPVTKIPLKKGVIKLIYKKGAGGGSGAGAALTKLAESSQALYAALVFNVLGREMTIKDVTKENFSRAAGSAITDEKFDSMVNNLPDDWINSSIAGANALYRLYKGKGSFTFHRGSKLVDAVEKTFTTINRQEGAFGNLNKWSPADIYMVGSGFNVGALQAEKTLKGLNEKMFEFIQSNQLIGVSLKKITGTGRISKKNFPTDKKLMTASYRGTSTNLDAMDGYIQWGSQTTEKIQFRSFGGEASLTGWQGEIKGASANQGKISLGPINFILNRHGLPKLPTSLESASLARGNTDKHARDIAQMMVTYGTVKSNQVEQVAEMIKQRSDKYRYSKYLVMILLTTITNAPAQIRDQVVQDFYLYASSQATYSAPYIKLE
jgi:hypothetical protein|tara:strand:- start:44 stop:1372 length:1329 start_codon:yes stop_codon:yes gene_type:complete